MTDAACVRCGVRRSAASPHVGAIAWPPTLEVPRRRQSEGCRMAGRDRRGSVRALRLIVQAHGPAGRARASSFLNCPRCELSARRKTRLLRIEYCPRWTAPAQIPGRLFSSALPTVEMHREGSVPHAEQPGVPTTITADSQ
jgi:hypothetical protein